MTTAERREAILAQLGRKAHRSPDIGYQVRRQPSGHCAGSVRCCGPRTRM